LGGEEGYPGVLTATVTYRLVDPNQVLGGAGGLEVEFRATTTRATLCNLASSVYFNLRGHAAGDVLGHKPSFRFLAVLATDEKLVPTDGTDRVAGTPFEFGGKKAIGEDIKAVGGKPAGYDVDYLSGGDGLRRIYSVREPESGRELHVLHDQLVMHFNTGNSFDGKTKGKDGAVYKQYAGFSLGSQVSVSNAVNLPKLLKEITNPERAKDRQDSTPILLPGKTYQSGWTYFFGADAPKDNPKDKE
jgi:aldose 1-epimerase